MRIRLTKSLNHRPSSIKSPTIFFLSSIKPPLTQSLPQVSPNSPTIFNQINPNFRSPRLSRFLNWSWLWVSVKKSCWSWPWSQSLFVLLVAKVSIFFLFFCCWFLLADWISGNDARQWQWCKKCSCLRAIQCSWYTGLNDFFFNTLDNFQLFSSSSPIKVYWGNNYMPLMLF